MTQPIIDILARGPRLTAAARESLEDVNAAYLSVHGVIARALSRLPQAIGKRVLDAQTALDASAPS